jgi:hypothetical protein
MSAIRNTILIKAQRQRNVLIAGIFLLLLVFSGLFFACENSRSKVEIRVGGESKESVETIAGATLTLKAEIIDGDKKTKNPVYIWTIESDALGAAIEPNGAECVVAVGAIAGSIKVSVSLEVDGSKTDNIVINIKEKSLQSVSVERAPDKTAYVEGELFDPTGLVVKANYEFLSETVANYSLSVTGRALTTSDSAVTVSYTRNGVTRTAEISITVTARSLTGIRITRPTVKTEYNEGEYLDVLGIEITASYSNSPDAVVYGWAHDKPNALALSDATVTVTYTENGLTETVSFAIVVNAVVVISPEAQAVIGVIDALPEVQSLTLANADAVAYAEGLYNALSDGQKSEVTNYEKLAAATARISELIASQPPIAEPEYGISYGVYGGLDFSDIDYGDNPISYKNGAFTLNAASSGAAVAQGYYFVRWLDADTYDTVTEIAGISADKTYLAVFELTAGADIVFFDYFDKATELLRLSGVSRLNLDGLYSYDLNANGIETAIFADNGLLTLAYYVVLKSGETVEAESGVIYLNYNAVITVYAVTAATRAVTIEPEFDGSIGWSYEYTADNAEIRNVHRSFTAGVYFNVPIGAGVTVYAVNPYIRDILIDGVKAGLLFPARQYIFELSAGEAAVEITFEYYATEIVSLTFIGVNTRVYAYQTANWDGKLSIADLNDIAFMFDEENDYYLNRYVIGGGELFYADLAGYVFSGNTVVTVNRTLNRFTLTVNYSGGGYSLTNLVGRQTLEAALITRGYGSDPEFTGLLDGILDSARLYSDGLYQTELSKAVVLSEYLIGDITLYAVWETAFTISFDTGNGSVHAPMAVEVSSLPDDIYGRLSERLPSPTLDGHTFIGWATERDGEAVTAEYIDTVIRNRESDITLYAVFEQDEVVEYSGDFVGAWSAVYNGNSGIVTANLTLNSNGAYSYDMFINGALSAGLTGAYRVFDGQITIITLIMQGVYQLISADDFKINAGFAGDNLLVATMFEADGMTVRSYDHVLTKGEVRPANYIGSEIPGVYSLTATENIDGVTTERVAVITLYANGTAEITATVKADGETVYSLTETGYYRITADGRIWLFNNGAFGVVDFTDMLALYVKDGQDS